MLESLIEKLKYTNMDSFQKAQFDKLDDKNVFDVFNTQELLKEADKRLKHIDKYMTNNISIEEFNNLTKTWSNNLWIKQ